MTIPRIGGSIALVGVLVLFAGAAISQTTYSGSGQAYPNKSIRMLAPEPGSNHEIAGRIVAQGISPGLDRKSVV